MLNFRNAKLSSKKTPWCRKDDRAKNECLYFRMEVCEVQKQTFIEIDAVMLPYEDWSGVRTCISFFGRCSKLMNRHIWKEQWNSKLRAMSTPTYLFLLNNVIVPLCIWDSIGDISISSILNNDRYLRLLKRFLSLRGCYLSRLQNVSQRPGVNPIKEI